MQRAPIKHRETFIDVLRQCPRSTTKGRFIDMTTCQSVLELTGSEINQIEKNIIVGYGEVHDLFVENPTSEYRAKTSYSAAQMHSLIVNTLWQLSFKTGDCLARSSLLVVELAKKRILNAHLVLSNPDVVRQLKAQTKGIKAGELEGNGFHHFYVLLSNPTSSSTENRNIKWFNHQQDAPLIRSATEFPPDYQYMDPWAGNACLWEEFKPTDERFTGGINEHPQYIFNSLAQIGNGITWVFEQFLQCLDAYEAQITSLSEQDMPSSSLSNLLSVLNALGSTLSNFDKVASLHTDLKMLCSFEQCQNTILENIQNLRAVFTTQLDFLKNEQAFRRAAGAGDLAKLKQIHEQGNISSIDAQDDQRSHRTALHWAVFNGKKDCVDWLMEQGASLTIRDKGDKTPFDLIADKHPEWLPELTPQQPSHSPVNS